MDPHVLDKTSIAGKLRRVRPTLSHLKYASLQHPNKFNTYTSVLENEVTIDSC